jgi:hypothetical protein
MLEVLLEEKFMNKKGDETAMKQKNVFYITEILALIDYLNLKLFSVSAVDLRAVFC